MSGPIYDLHSTASPVILTFGSSVSAEFLSHSLLLVNEDELC
jgi:hypothetical protein